MVPFIRPHSTGSYNGDEPLQRDIHIAPKSICPDRQLDSPLNPNAPVFLLPDAKSKKGPSRERLRSLIAEKEQQRRDTLQSFKVIGARLKRSKAIHAHVDELPDPEQYREQHPEQYKAREQEIEEIENLWSRIGDNYRTLCDEIEELWGAMAVAPD